MRRSDIYRAPTRLFQLALAAAVRGAAVISLDDWRGANVEFL